jgi:hypothetical protein
VIVAKSSWSFLLALSGFYKALLLFLGIQGRVLFRLAIVPSASSQPLIAKASHFHRHFGIPQPPIFAEGISMSISWDPIPSTAMHSRPVLELCLVPINKANQQLSLITHRTALAASLPSPDDWDLSVSYLSQVPEALKAKVDLSLGRVLAQRTTREARFWSLYYSRLRNNAAQGNVEGLMVWLRALAGSTREPGSS